MACIANRDGQLWWKKFDFGFLSAKSQELQAMFLPISKVKTFLMAINLSKPEIGRASSLFNWDSARVKVKLFFIKRFVFWKQLLCPKSWCKTIFSGGLCSHSNWRHFKNSKSCWSKITKAIKPTPSPQWMKVRVASSPFLVCNYR